MRRGRYGGWPELVFAAIVTAGVTLWWVFVKPASSIELMQFVERTAAAHGDETATELKAALNGAGSTSLFSAWRLYRKSVSPSSAELQLVDADAPQCSGDVACFAE